MNDVIKQSDKICSDVFKALLKHTQRLLSQTWGQIHQSLWICAGMKCLVYKGAFQLH